MKNKWRTYFIILAFVSIGSILFLSYTLIDKNVTITYMQEGYRDTEDDLRAVLAVMENKLMKEDFTEIAGRNPYTNDTLKIELNRISFIFGNDGRLKHASINW